MLLCNACANLCSVDEPPSVQEAEAVLVAVVETSSIHPPVCAEVTLEEAKMKITNAEKRMDSPELICPACSSREDILPDGPWWP